MDRIGVRELRQHASRYLARVAAGETLEVTDRGRPVARLGPVPVDSWDQMIADGRIIPASDPDAFLDITPKHYPGPSASEVLAAMREDER
ncbi:MAG TPA: type II toxin-antitoxin system prevent-host-death family antitoxin [Jatrophihabitantaceae bacterium]|jgi:prevent-host-death family protein